MFKKYVDFEVQIVQLENSHFTVNVHAPGGDARGTFTSPSDEPAYQKLLDRLRRFDTQENDLVELGENLFRSLFHGPVKDVYTRSQGTLEQDEGMRLRFIIDPSSTEVAMLPWELLNDPDQGPLAMLDMSVVRYIQHQAVRPSQSAPLPLKVLITSAQTPPQINVERELHEVVTALRGLGNKVHIVTEPHLTRSKLQRHLRQGFHIWHFIGHGGFTTDNPTGHLLFEDETGDVESVNALQLGVLLNRCGLRLIVLDACEGSHITHELFRSLAPASIRAQVPTVVAMQFSVPEDVTRIFASEFYSALAEGFPIDACVTEGRRAILGAFGLRYPDWATPTVYTRALENQLFDTDLRSQGDPRQIQPLEQRTIQAASNWTLEQHANTIPSQRYNPRHEVNQAQRFRGPEPSNQRSSFIAGPPIDHPHMFFGREREVMRVFHLIKRLPLQNAAIIGPRRSGKTSLLRYLQSITQTPEHELRPGQRADWLAEPERYKWIFVDFQNARFSSKDGLLRYLLTQLKMPVPTVCDIGNFSDVVSSHLILPTILLLDEISVALQRHPEFDNTFWESLRALATSDDIDGNLSFVLASSEAPHLLAQHNSIGSPFFNIFGYTATLGPFTDIEARDFIRSSPIPFSDADTEWILEKSGRWPMLLQILCRERLLVLEEGETSTTWQEEGMRQMAPFAHLINYQ